MTRIHSMPALVVAATAAFVVVAPAPAHAQLISSASLSTGIAGSGQVPSPATTPPSADAAATIRFPRVMVGFGLGR